MAHYSHFEIEFSQRKTQESRSVKFNIESHSLAQRWASMFHDLLRKNAHLEKNYLLHGWQNTARDMSYLCQEMNRHIQIVNRFFSSKPKGLFYQIDQNFSPDKVNQNELNKIHHHFELLIGQVWDFSTFYKASPPKIQYSIRQINNLCHEMENVERSAYAFEKGRCQSYLVAAFFEHSTVPLLPEDHVHFDLYHNFGDVILHYAQLGKTHQEAYSDQDEIVNDKNITSLRFLSGEFDIIFSDSPPLEIFHKNTQKFKAWLISKGVNPEEHNLGYARVATLDKSQLPNQSTIEIMKELFKFDDISQLTVVFDGKVFSQSYDYHWDTHDNEKNQIGYLNKAKRNFEKNDSKKILQIIRSLFNRPNL